MNLIILKISYILLIFFILIKVVVNNVENSCPLNNFPQLDETNCSHSKNLLFCIEGLCRCPFDITYRRSYFKTEWSEKDGICVGLETSHCDHNITNENLHRAKLFCKEDSNLYCTYTDQGAGAYIQHGYCRDTSNDWIYILIGVGGFVLFVALIITCICCVFIKKRKLLEKVQRDHMAVHKIYHINQAADFDRPINNDIPAGRIQQNFVLNTPPVPIPVPVPTISMPLPYEIKNSGQKNDALPVPVEVGNLFSGNHNKNSKIGFEGI